MLNSINYEARRAVFCSFVVQNHRQITEELVTETSRDTKFDPRTAGCGATFCLLANFEGELLIPQNRFNAWVKLFRGIGIFMPFLWFLQSFTILRFLICSFMLCVWFIGLLKRMNAWMSSSQLQASSGVWRPAGYWRPKFNEFHVSSVFYNLLFVQFMLPFCISGRKITASFVDRYK
jgi:hypothetical protein